MAIGCCWIPPFIDISDGNAWYESTNGRWIAPSASSPDDCLLVCRHGLIGQSDMSAFSALNDAVSTLVFGVKTNYHHHGIKKYFTVLILSGRLIVVV